MKTFLALILTFSVVLTISAEQTNKTVISSSQFDNHSKSQIKSTAEFVGSSEYINFYSTQENDTIWPYLSSFCDDLVIELLSYWERPLFNNLLDDQKIDFYLYNRAELAAYYGGELPNWKCGAYKINEKSVAVVLPESSEQIEFYESFKQLVQGTVGQLILAIRYHRQWDYNDPSSFFMEGFGLYFSGQRPEKQNIINWYNNMGRYPERTDLEEVPLANYTNQYYKDLIISFIQYVKLADRGYYYMTPNEDIPGWQAHWKHYYLNPEDELIKIYYSSENFDIYCTAQDAEDAAAMANTCEIKLAEYKQYYGIEVPHRIDVVIYPNADVGTECFGTQHNGGHAVGSGKFDIISSKTLWVTDENPGGGLEGVLDFLIPHELFHAYHNNFWPFYTQVGRFYIEGLANFMAGFGDEGYLEIDNYDDDLWKIGAAFANYRFNQNREPALQDFIDHTQNDPYYFGEHFFNYLKKTGITFEQIKNFFIGNKNWEAYPFTYETLDTGYVNYLKRYAHLVPQTSPLQLPFNEEFNDFSNGWGRYNSSSLDNWYTEEFGTDNKCARFYNYTENIDTNQAWLISPLFDATGLNQVYISFDAAFGENINIDVFYTENYSDPLNETDWTQIEDFDISSSLEWKNTGEMVLENPPEHFHIGIRYSSIGEVHQSCAIDNFLVSNERKTIETAELPFWDDFEETINQNATFNNWTTQNEKGWQYWHMVNYQGINGSQCMRFENNDTDQDDWLITKAIDCSEAQKLRIQFDVLYNGTGVKPKFLYKSLDIEDNSSSEWIELNYLLGSKENEWYSVDEISIDNPGDIIYFAFHTDQPANQGIYFLLDNFRVENDLIPIPFELVGSTEHFEFYTDNSENANYWQEIKDKLEEQFNKYQNYWDIPGAPDYIEQNTKTKIYLSDRENIKLINEDTPNWKMGFYSCDLNRVYLDNSILQLSETNTTYQYYNGLEGLAIHTFAGYALQLILNRDANRLNLPEYFAEGFGLYERGYRPNRDSVISFKEVHPEFVDDAVMARFTDYINTSEKDIVTAFVEYDILLHGGYRHCNYWYYDWIGEEWEKFLYYFYTIPDNTEQIKKYDECEHFDFYCSPQDIMFIDSMKVWLNQTHNYYVDSFEIELNIQVPIVILDQKAGSELTGSPDFNGGSGNINISPRDFFGGFESYNWLLGHEVGHVFNDFMCFAEPYYSMPFGFYHEGMANFSGYNIAGGEHRDDRWKITAVFDFYQQEYSREPTLEEFINDPDKRIDCYFFGFEFIRYLRKNEGYLKIKEFFVDKMDFSVFNESYDELEQGYIEYLKYLQSEDKNYPVVTTNTGLTLDQGSSAVITTENLSISDQEASDDGLFFEIVTNPTKGHLAKISNPGTPISKFSEQNLKQEQIIYVNDSTSATSDFFTFSITDEVHGTGDFRFDITLIDPTTIYETVELPFYDDFSNDYENWDTQSIAGEDLWHLSGDDGIDGSKCARFYNYASTETNDDWLISPVFNTKNLEALRITFKYLFNTDGIAPDFYYASNFNGNPEDSYWTPIDKDFWTSDGGWQDATIDIENPEESFVFAVRYQVASGSAFYFLMDNFSIKSFEPINYEKIGTTNHFEFYSAIPEGAQKWKDISSQVENWYAELCSYWDRPGREAIYESDVPIKIFLTTQQGIDDAIGINFPDWKYCGYKTPNELYVAIPPENDPVYNGSFAAATKNILSQLILKKRLLIEGNNYLPSYFSEAFAQYYCGYRPNKDSIRQAISDYGGYPNLADIKSTNGFDSTYHKDLLVSYIESQALTRIGIQRIGYDGYETLWQRHFKYFYEMNDDDCIQLREQTDHFDLYFTEQDWPYMSQITSKLEEKYAHYTNVFDLDIKHKFSVVIYPSEEIGMYNQVYSDNYNGGSGWSGDLLDFLSPVEFSGGIDEALRSLIPHEFFHAFHFNFVTHLFDIAPFNSEGMAELMAYEGENKEYLNGYGWYFEQGFDRFENENGREPKLADIMPDSDFYMSVYTYGQAFWYNMLQNYTDYVTIKEFFEKGEDWSVFDISYDEIDAAYIAYLKSFFEEAETKPEISTLPASEIKIDGATLNGEVISNGGTTITQRGFYWSSANSSPGSSDYVETVSETIGEFSFELTGLSPSTTYYFRAFGTNSEGTSVGEIKNFTTDDNLSAYLKLPFFDDFSNDYENWNTYSASGDLQWHISGDDGPDGSKCARIYTNNSLEENDDWLISPTFTTDSIAKIRISFDYWHYGNNLTPEFYYSTNYTGDFENADWTKINYSFAINEWTWKNIYFDLNVPEDTFAFAFHYRSGVGDDNKIQIDNFSITEMETNQHLTARQAAAEMRHGINLGNTMEPPTEAGWNNPKAQEYYFDLYKEAGFDVVRIPVRWDNHTDESVPYKINENWLNRVEQLVDWGLERGLYIVINAHHEDWLKENYDNPDYRERFDSIWSQVATHFKDKPDKLIFEIFNEPTTQTVGLTVEQNNEVNARIISIIRKTNPTRIVIFQGNDWGGSYDLFEAAVPEDDYLMGSYHSYSPYEFALLGEGIFTEEDYNNLSNEFINVKNWSDANQIPVFLGEFGALKSCDYNSRMKQYSAYASMAQEYNIIPCAWDDGGNFRILEREAKYWNEVKDILIYNSLEAPKDLTLEVHQDSTIKVSWTNVVLNNDSIFIERRKTTDTLYTKIATLESGESVFDDIKPAPEVTYHYRVIAHYNDTTDRYSYPQKLYMPIYVTSVEVKESFTNNFKIYPNPITSQSVISFHTQTTGEINLSIFDIQGRKVCTLIDEERNAGKHSIPLSNSLPINGIYLCKLITSDGVATIRIIKND